MGGIVENRTRPVHGSGNGCPQAAFSPYHYPSLHNAVQLLLAYLYRGLRKSKPQTNNTPKLERNAEVRALHVEGWSVPELSVKFGISRSRVYEILKASRS